MKCIDIKRQMGVMVLSFAMLHSVVVAAAQWDGVSGSGEQKDFSTQISVIMDGFLSLDKQDLEKMHPLFYPKSNELTSWNSDPAFWQILGEQVQSMFGSDWQMECVNTMQSLHPSNLQKVKSGMIKNSTQDFLGSQDGKGDNVDDSLLEYVKNLSLQQENHSDHNEWDEKQIEDKKHEQQGERLWVTDEQTLELYFNIAITQNQMGDRADYTCGPCSMRTLLSVGGNKNIDKDFILKAPFLGLNKPGQRSGAPPAKLAAYSNRYCLENGIDINSEDIGADTFSKIEEAMISNTRSGNPVDVLFFYGPKTWHYVFVYFVKTTKQGQIEYVWYWNPSQGTKQKATREELAKLMDKQNDNMSQGQHAFLGQLGADLATPYRFNAIVANLGQKPQLSEQSGGLGDFVDHGQDIVTGFEGWIHPSQSQYDAQQNTKKVVRGVFGVINNVGSHFNFKI